MTETNAEGPQVVAPSSTPTHILVRTRRGRWLTAASWLYAAVVLVALGMIRWLGDGWWLTTVILFSPRWLFLAPIALLLVLSIVRRTLAPWFVLTATAIVVLGPLMGLNLPIAHRLQTTPDGERLRIATFNLSMDPLPAIAIQTWLDMERIDVICFQEGGRTEDEIRKRLREDGWFVSKKFSVASRLPIVAEMTLIDDEYADEERYSAALERVRLRTKSGSEIVVASVHLPTIRKGFEKFSKTKRVADLKSHKEWWRKQLGRVLSALAEVDNAPLLVAGDFNMPSDDSAMASLQTNFRFAFEEAGWGYGYTRPSDTPWVRIDHILTGPDWRVVFCRIGPDFGSDHLPVEAEVVLVR